MSEVSADDLLRAEYHEITKAWRGSLAFPPIHDAFRHAAARFLLIIEQPIRTARMNDRISYEYSEDIVRRAAHLMFAFARGCIAIGLEYGLPPMASAQYYPLGDDHIMRLLALASEDVADFLGQVISECRLDTPNDIRNAVLDDIARDMLDLELDLFLIGANASDELRRIMRIQDRADKGHA